MDDISSQLIARYLDRILDVNQRINLTRIVDKDEALLLHIEDSLSVEEEMTEAPEGLYGDLGSGGGFPGVPLAIKTGRETILIDSVQKKMNAVHGVLEELQLDSQIKVSGERIETLGSSMKGQFSVLTARALDKLNVLIELASPLLKEGGHLICLKANADEEEIEHALVIEKQVAMKLVKRRAFELSDGKTHREVFVFEKQGEPLVSLPRKIGQAKRKPLM